MTTGNRTFPAKMDAVPEMMDFISGLIDDFPSQAAYDTTLVCEEILVNIASYAYPQGEGGLCLRWEKDTEARRMTLVFEDSGVPFDPLSREEPDLNVPVKEREIGGLGVMMIRKLTDSVQYSRTNGKNILTVVKQYGKAR